MCLILFVSRFLIESPATHFLSTSFCFLALSYFDFTVFRIQCLSASCTHYNFNFVYGSALFLLLYLSIDSHTCLWPFSISFYTMLLLSLLRLRLLRLLHTNIGPFGYCLPLSPSPFSSRTLSHSVSLGLTLIRSQQSRIGWSTNTPTPSRKFTFCIGDRTKSVDSDKKKQQN